MRGLFKRVLHHSNDFGARLSVDCFSSQFACKIEDPESVVLAMCARLLAVVDSPTVTRYMFLVSPVNI
jgi:hypothetical protein